MMIARCGAAVLVGVFLLAVPRSAFPATFDPAFRFSTVETEHFSIHFHQGTDEIAARVAATAERVHARVAPAMRWTPAGKTQVVLVDGSDFANGFAGVIPYNVIYLYLSSPFPDSTIGEYADWLGIVFLHEYVHILTMDPSRGFASVMRGIFGKPLPGADPLSLLVFLFAAPPNVFMPYWWLEGISTWAETEFTASGRGRSSYYEMIFRMDVLEDRVPRISDIDGHRPDWPSGNLPYIYGMLIQKYIAHRYGKDIPGRISIQQSGRAPFFISAPARTHAEKDYVRLYREVIEALKEEQGGKIDLLRSVPLTEYRILPLDGEKFTNPRLSPDGRYLAVNRRDPHEHEAIVIMDANSFEEVARVRRLYSDHTMAWSPDATKLYFTQGELRGAGGYNLYQDVYVYDLIRDSVTRVTRNARAKEIDLSPDGRSLAYVSVEAGAENIVLCDLAAGTGRTIAAAEAGHAMSGPRWSPDGRTIVWSVRDDRGNTSLALYEEETQNARILLSDAHANIYPAWTPDGAYLLFTSDRTGVYNLFAYSLETGSVAQVTHVLGGLFHAEVSQEADRVLFTGYHARGYYIGEMPYDPSRWMSDRSPAVRPLWGKTEPATEDGTEQAEPAEEPVHDDIRPPLFVAETVEAMAGPREATSISGAASYSPLPTLVPRFWLPTLSADGDGVAAGAFTAGQDVLGYHAYLLQGAFGIDSRQVYADAVYLYDRWYPSFVLRGSTLPVLYSELFDDETDYWERRTSLTGGVILPLVSLESRYSLLAGYTYEKNEGLTEDGGRTVGGLGVFEGRRDHVFVGLQYTGALRYPYSISREEGRNISLTYKNYARSLGSDLSQREYAGAYEEFIGLWSHHVLTLRLKGATADGDRIAQQAFRIGGFTGTANEYPVRGFEQGFAVGRSVVTGSLEYRFPIKYILRGWGSKPFFWDRLHAAVFVDAGNVWGDGRGFDDDDVSVGAGVEVRFDMVLGYKLPITPAAGIAQGLTDDGITQVYITFYAGL